MNENAVCNRLYINAYGSIFRLYKPVKDVQPYHMYIVHKTLKHSQKSRNSRERAKICIYTFTQHTQKHKHNTHLLMHTTHETNSNFSMDPSPQKMFRHPKIPPRNTDCV